MMTRTVPLSVLFLALAIGVPAWGSGIPSIGETMPGRPEVLPQNPLTFEEAVGRYYDGRFEESLDGLRGILDREPEHRPAREQLARLLREEGRYIEAREQILALLGNPGEERPRWERELLIVSVLGGMAPEKVPEPVEASADGAPQAAAEDGAANPPDAEALFWSGLALFERGDLPTSRRMLLASLKAESYNPAGYYFLGLIDLREGAFAEAEARLNEALRQEPSLTMAFVPLARAKIGTGSFASAHGLLLRARASLPGNREVENLLASLLADRPELTAVREEDARQRRIRTVTPVMKTFPAGPAEAPVVRIGLAEGIDRIHVKTGGPFILESGDRIIHRGGQASVLSVIHSGDRISISGEQGDMALDLQEPVSLRYEDVRLTTALFDMEFGSGYYFAGTEDRFYRGILEFSSRPDGITVVNAVGLEEYLYSTVPSEMPASWPEESLRAQAIAARSYTLANLGRFASRGFDLMGSVRSASYRGAGNEAERTTRAVDSTRGTILVAGGRPLDAVYSANTGGYTESAESVWGFPAPLPAVADPKAAVRRAPVPPEELHRWLLSRPESYSAVPGYHSRAAYRWKLWIPAEEIAARAGNGKIGRIVSLTTRGRGISGRVERVLVRGTDGSVEVKGDSIRSRLGGLRSNLFTVEPKLGADGYPAYFLFTGGGWGHGVGMDQSGAAGMAADGWTAERILAHYYPRAQLAAEYGRGGPAAGAGDSSGS